MKYGILTFHNIPNIGALLQAYSLCETVRNIGVDCDIIDYRCENIVKRELIYKPHHNLFKDIILRLFWYKTKKKIKLCKEYMNSKHIYSTKQYSKDNLEELNCDYDSFISGSDMIWNLNVTGNDLNYFLEFADSNKGKFSYASSIGDKWAGSDIDKIFFLLSKYQKISVRETDTCEQIKNMGMDCVSVVDPTMLIATENWEYIAVEPKQKKYLLVYFSNKIILSSARKYAKQHNLRIVLINYEYPVPFVKNVAPNTPPEWIGYFKYADAVFTNSYHGLLFSLYFKKPVWSANYSNRIISLLKLLNLEFRLLKNDEKLSTSINYDTICEKISKLREGSLNYLKSIVR